MPFLSDFINLGPFPPPFCHVGKGFVDLVNLFKESSFCLIDSLNNLFGLGPDLYFPCSADLGFSLFLFS
jgi:hypothetical protein